MAEYLEKMGSSAASLKRQIEGEMAWRRLLSREVEPFISVSDEEVNQVIARMQASKGAPEYHVSEIFLSATPATDQQVQANAQRIVSAAERARRALPIAVDQPFIVLRLDGLRAAGRSDGVLNPWSVDTVQPSE